MEQYVDISQEQAESILQVQRRLPGFAEDWFVVCQGYEDDWNTYTELIFEDLESIAEGCYDHYQLWHRR